MAYQSIDDYKNANLGGWGGPSVTTLGGVDDGGGNAANAGIMGGLLGLFNGSSAFGGVNKNGTQSMGWAMPALGIAQAGVGLFNGNKQLKLAENQFKEGKRQFDLNYGAQRTTVNSQLEDRQRARVASNPGAYESVGSYLDKNRIN